MEMVNLDWCNIKKRAFDIADKIIEDLNTDALQFSLGVMFLYGVPRGGIYAVQAVLAALDVSSALWPKELKGFVITEEPERANVLIDDIIDTGKTKTKCQSVWTHASFFYALVDKQGDDKGIGWISFPWERMINDNGPVENVRRLLEYAGDDPEREGLKETPERVIKSYEKLFGGYRQDPKEVIKVFEEVCDEMVLVKDIEFYSTCEHHMLPFFGKAHIAYIPNGKVIGVSKLVRVLEIYARRLQIQERLCQQVTNALQGLLDPLGVACVLEAQHFCMICRGVEKQNSIMVTSSLKGVFRDKSEARAEFMRLIGR